MNRLSLVLLAACLGAAGFTLFHQRAAKSQAATVMVVGQLQSGTNELASTQEAVSSLRDEIQEKRQRLRQALPHPNITPEMLVLLEGHKPSDQAGAWAELRQQLGIGWDTSPDYVLVGKPAIKDVWYNKLLGDGTLSDDAAQLLSLSPDEQEAIKAALTRAREGQWLNVQSTPPSRDMVAQLTITPPDPAFEEAQSNNFVADITSAIGPERAGLFLPDAWREFVGDLAPTTAETMTIRQTNVDGQPDLVCEVTQGIHVSTMPVRYGYYPSFLLKLFPGGWQAMAQALGFNLPPSFMPQSNQ